jgi:hypothetical protein
LEDGRAMRPHLLPCGRRTKFIFIPENNMTINKIVAMAACATAAAPRDIGNKTLDRLRTNYGKINYLIM